MNGKIPRIVKRFEKAFEDIGIAFQKTRPARLLLSKMAKEPEKIVTPSTSQRMEVLFVSINKAHRKIVDRSIAPFN